MIAPMTARKQARRPVDSIWRRDIGELLARGGTVPAGELAVFCSKLSFLLEAGVALKDALPLVAAQCKGRTLCRAAGDVHSRIMQGESLAGACAAAGAFPDFVCGLFEVGEKTAQLPRVCKQLADYYEQQAQTKREVLAALVYPAGVALMMLAVIIAAVVFVLPGYAAVFATSDAALPGLTRGLLAVSDFVTVYGWLLGAGLLAVVIALHLLARTNGGARFFSWVQLRFGVYRRGVALHIAQVLELMLQANQPLAEAIRLCAKTQRNTFIVKDLNRAEVAVLAGQSLGTALAQLSYVDPLLAGMAQVGEESGKLPQTLTQCRIQNAQNHKQALQKLNKLAEPAVTLTMGVLLALVMLAIVLPTFELAMVF